MYQYDVEAFMSACDRKGLAAKTMKSYEQTLRLFGLFLAERGITQTEEIRHPHIEAYIDTVRKRGKYTVCAVQEPVSPNYPERRRDYGKKVSPVTINNYLRNMKAFFNWCVREELIRKNPIKPDDTIKVERKPLAFVTDAEFKKLLACLDTSKFSEYRDSEYLFCTNEGKPLRVNNFEANIRKYAQRIGLKEIHPHCFRNNFAKRFLMNGGDIYTLSRLLGHSSVTVTERAYLDVDTDDLHDLYQKYSPMENMGL